MRRSKDRGGPVGAKGSRGRACRANSNPSRGSRSRSARYPRLKPGPGRSAEDVAAHQRGRLQAALVELVAEQGYNAVTMAALVDRAGVSKRDFYKHFTSKENCFIATYDLIVERSVRKVLAATDGEDEWCERLRLGFLAFAGQIADSPEAAQLALVEVFAADRHAVQDRDRVVHVDEHIDSRQPVVRCGASDERIDARPRDAWLDPEVAVGGVPAHGVRVGLA